MIGGTHPSPPGRVLRDRACGEPGARHSMDRVPGGLAAPTGPFCFCIKVAWLKRSQCPRRRYTAVKKKLSRQELAYFKVCWALKKLLIEVA